MRSIVCVLFLLPLTGCLMEVLTTTAIQGELQAEGAAAATRQLSQARDQVNRDTMRQAIGIYTAETGTYPPSLEILVPDYLAEVPVAPGGVAYIYDPYTGKVIDSKSDIPQITIPVSDADRAMIADLRDAIADYADWTGYYPDSLEDLVPDYIVYVPDTTSRHAFVYYPETGTVKHPARVQNRRVAPVNSTSMGMGGSGLLGNTMTGIGMQQQLDNMGAGSSAAGMRGRQNIDQIQSDYSDRQMQMIDDLDL